VLRVAIDGPDAAGKSTLADALAARLAEETAGDVSPDEALRRALERDVELLGGGAGVRERYRRRYLPGQQIYRAAASPEATADVVIDNTDPVHPHVLTWPGTFPSR
jgi:nicotinamide riboside kinase